MEIEIVALTSLDYISPLSGTKSFTNFGFQSREGLIAIKDQRETLKIGSKVGISDTLLGPVTFI